MAGVGASAGTDRATFESRWQLAIANDQAARFAPLLNEVQDAGTLVSLSGPTGKNALMVACKQGDLALARRLQVLGADIRTTTLTGGTPFMFAALGNHRDVATWLRVEGANLDAAGANGWTATMIAAAKGFDDLLGWLISIGADVNRSDVYGFTPLMRAVDNAQDAAVAVLLAVKGIDVNAQDEAGNTALHHAMAGDHSLSVKRLLDGGAEMTLHNRAGQTPEEVATGRQDR